MSNYSEMHFHEVLQKLIKLKLIDDLKPCPFCGSKAEFIFGEIPEDNPLHDSEWMVIGCTNCSIRTHQAFVDVIDGEIVKKDVILNEIVRWNRRVGEKRG